MVRAEGTGRTRCQDTPTRLSLSPLLLFCRTGTDAGAVQGCQGGVRRFGFRIQIQSALECPEKGGQSETQPHASLAVRADKRRTCKEANIVHLLTGSVSTLSTDQMR